MVKNIRVLYFGLYEPSYARNWVLINGLKKNGVEVIELRRKSERFSLIKLFLDYLKLKKDFDIMIVGFPGQEVMFMARLLVWKKPIIFDAFTSHYGGYILDRKRWAKNSIRANYFRFLDKWSCKLANIVLLDTRAHIEFFVKEFGLSGSNFRSIWIGANDDNFRPLDVGKSGDGVFNVIFFGTYVPLQGAEYIVRAAKILEKNSGVFFHFYGKGQDGPACMSLAKQLGLKNIEFIGMIKPEELRLKIASADVVLGLFGNTPKTPLVIPNKVYEAIAMKKPVITADTPAIRELFGDEDMILVNPANPAEIARAIIEIKNNPALGEKISEKGYEKFLNHASSRVLGFQLKLIIEECLKRRKF